MLLLLGGDLQPLQNEMQAFLDKVKKWSIISDDRSINDILDGIYYGLFKNKYSFPTIVYIIFCQMSAIVYMVSWYENA